MGVKFKRDEAEKAEQKYKLIEDAIDGEIAIKRFYNQTRYLPIPSSCANASQTDPQYVSYLTRAVYYNVTQPTRDALVGQLFLRAPVVELPTEMELMVNDINGEGLNLAQLIRKAANYVLPYGRGGLLADFPTTEGSVTLDQLESGEIRPTIKFYEPWSIRNWRVRKVGKFQKLILVVLDEAFEKESQDEFETKTEIRQRVYKLINNEVTVSVYEDEKLTSGPIKVLDSTGTPLTEIPFRFIGSENNDSDVDEPPFYGLASLNLGHYRNSADYEESCFLLGQPTLAMSGLTQDWVENNFKDGITLGARGSIPMPEGGKAELLQCQPNTLAFEAMQHKEEQMIAIGAKILRPNSQVEKKQAEIEIEAASQRSVLMTIKTNLELALLASLKVCAGFVGADPDSIKLELNDNFDLQSMAPEQLRFLIELYKENMIAFVEIRATLIRSGIATLPVDEVKSELVADKTMKDSLVSELDKQKAMKPATPVGKKPSTK